MYSYEDYDQAASRREAMAAARHTQTEPQAIAATMPAREAFLSSLLSLIISPLFLFALINVVILLSLALILLGL